MDINISPSKAYDFSGCEARSINKPMWGEVGMIECYLVGRYPGADLKNLHLCPVTSFQQDPVNVYTILKVYRISQGIT